MPTERHSLVNSLPAVAAAAADWQKKKKLSTKATGGTFSVDLVLHKMTAYMACHIYSEGRKPNVLHRSTKNSLPWPWDSIMYMNRGRSFFHVV